MKTKFQIGDILQFEGGYYYIHAIDIINNDYRLTSVKTNDSDYWCNVESTHKISTLVTDAFRQHE